MTGTTVTETVLRRDRLVVGAGLAVLCGLGWAWLLMGGGMSMSVWSMTTAQFPPPAGLPDMAMEWNAGVWLVMLAMWWVMMVAMMTPSAAPMILLYARVMRHAQARERMPQTAIPTAAFAAGYLLAWFGFSLAATGLHRALDAAGLIHGVTMWSTSRAFSGAILIAAGLYQLSPLKAVCLEHCRSPADYLSRHWRKGRTGALRMGVIHGAYCVGCCWVLMALLFVGGVMNLLWIAGLTILVAAEKLLPRGQWISRVSGIALLGLGAGLLLT